MNQMQSRPAESWKFTPANTAVVVVDMQNIWVHPRGARYLPTSEAIVPRIQELLRYCHDRKIPVVYLHTTKRKDLADAGIFADIKPQSHDADNEWSNFEGTPGAEIYEPLKPTQGDIVVKKFRYNGFYGTQLENLLRALGAIPSRSPVSQPTSAAKARRGTAPCETSKLSFYRIVTQLSRKKSRMRP